MMATPKPSASPLQSLLQKNLQRLKDELLKLDLVTAARQTGFQQRLPRKIPMPQFALALVALAAETVLSLERIATVISLAAHTSYSKQAFHQRLGLPLDQFLAQVATLLLDHLGLAVKNEGWFRPFRRVLLHDSTVEPLPEHLYLLGWNLFVTNVSRHLWPARALQPIYRLRWRVEMIFKAWKSHLGLRQLNCRTAPLLSLSVLTKLLFCIIVYQLCNTLELLGDHFHRQHLSLLRLARILGHCACWFAATLIGLTIEQWIEVHLQKHAFYEPRKDRKNFYELLGAVTHPLA